MIGNSVAISKNVVHCGLAPNSEREIYRGERKNCRGERKNYRGEKKNCRGEKKNCRGEKKYGFAYRSDFGPFSKGALHAQLFEALRIRGIVLRIDRLFFKKMYGRPI